MTRPLPALVACAAVLAVAGAGCGRDIEVPKGDPLREGAQLFNDRCGGCHTFDAAATLGSKPSGQVSGGERTNGPSFDTRAVKRDDALFAIRNGGFSGAIMPANIVVGEQAEKVAAFLEKYSGRKASAK